MIFKAWKKPLSLLSIFSLLINQVLFVPLVLAEESTPSAQLVTTEASPSPAPSTTPEPTTTPIPSVSPEATASASPGASPTSSGTPVLVSDWQDVEGKAITKNNVALDHTYTAPQNSKVTVKFNKLPEISGKLIIKEIKLTADQMNQTGALSDIAYDISSSMTDGTFEYTLTLPTTKTQNVEVKSSEDGNSFVTLGGVSAQTDTLTITGLNHFTIFVVAGIITSPGPGSFIGEPFNESTASAVINEFSYDPSSGQSEWIEILNKTGNDIDLSGWTVSDTANHVRDLSGTLPANGLVVYTNTGDSWMNDTDSSGDGDTIYLKNGADTIDEVTYQQQANNTVIDNTSDVGSVSSGNSVYRTSDGGSSWITGTPTKGWFNSAGQEGAAPLLSDIDSQLYGDESSEEDRVDSNIGELENPSNTPEGDSGLYFEVAGEGKIIFTASLNLTNQATVVVLQSLGQKMEMTDGHLEFDSQTASDMAVTGAKLYMYGINNLGYSSENQPNVIVSDDSGDEIYDDDENYPIIPGSLVYDPNVNDGQIVFDAAHFTQFDVENLNADTTSPDISSVLIDPVVDFDYLKGTVRVSANVTDDTGVSSVNFDFYNYWDIGEPEASCEGEPDENGVWSCSIDTTPLSEDLSYYLQVTAYDAAGNSSNNYYYTDWGSDELYADNAAPQTSDSGTDSDWHNSDVTVTLDCSDYSSGCSNTYYTTDGSDPTTSSSTGNEVILTENGEYTIKYFSDDYAGNQEEIKTVANTVKIDKTAPSGLGTTSTSPNPTTSTTQTWTWSAATDTLSGIAQYIWR
ncbi:lamin tail domain-containing protein, partial [Candidatus Daviesbacteria bacterium]|nr:lamin tail domain-containing protein [Candidatus Daviesbacteria bacterium]